MTTPWKAGLAGTLDIDPGRDLDLGMLLFLRGHEERGNVHLHSRKLNVAVTADVIRPGTTLVQAAELPGGTFFLGVDGDVVVLVRSWTTYGSLVVSAPTAEAARAYADAVAERLPSPPPKDERVGVRFCDAEAETRYLRLDVRPWAEVEPLYPAAVRTALGAVMAHRATEPEPRRLLVWYGPPGTGKTTAARALLKEWEDWADGVVVSDPDRLLTDGRYLHRVVLDHDDESDKGRWTLFVLEDAEALLHTSTRATSALGKLLNLADGMLGQGLRCLFLLTTNEPVSALHPALVRPGRCLARIEFPALSAAETSAVLGRPVDRGQTLAEVMAARAVATEAPAVAVGQYL